MDNKASRYHAFASAQAVLAVMVSFGLALLYKFRPDLTRNSSAAFASIMLTVLIVGYYLSFHQLLKHKLVSASTIVVSAITAANIWLVVTQTGGLDSPYLALWLVYIAALGVLGRFWPVVAATLTISVYTASIILNHPTGSELTTRVIQLSLLLAAAGIAQVLAAHSRSHTPANPAGIDQSSLQTQALLSSMGEGVVVVNTARQIQLFNRAAQILTGWEPTAAQNLDYRSVLQLKTSQDQSVSDKIDPFMKAWSRNTSVVTSNLTITTQAGRQITITLTTSPILDPQGRITGGIGLFRDISAEKLIERQRDEFISTASHEMRTPIAAIEGYLSLAMTPLTATIDERARGYLDKAHASLGHLGELFKNLSVITKLEDEQLADKIEVIDISQLVRSAVEDMQTLAQKQHLSLRLTSGPQLVASANLVLPIFWARGNAERLREVVMNLIENAVKYTSNGSVTVSVSGTGENITVSVTDSGLGIAREDLPHLFQKFYRVDNSATRTIGGTGLGLYICRTVVERYGGQIWVESNAGRGSTFSFRLPQVNNVAAVPAPVKPLAPQAVSVDALSAPTIALGQPSLVS